MSLGGRSWNTRCKSIFYLLYEKCRQKRKVLSHRLLIDWILRPGTGECLIQRQYDHGCGLRPFYNIVLVSFVSKWRNSFADHVIYLVSLRRFLRAVINQSQNLRLSFQLSTNKKRKKKKCLTELNASYTADKQVFGLNFTTERKTAHLGCGLNILV